MLDTRIHRFLTHYHPQPHSFSKPCFSACGTFIFASVGAKVCVYKTESGRLVTEYSPKTLPSFPNVNVCEAIYHPFDHTVGFSLYGHHGFLAFKFDKDTNEIRQEPIKLSQGKHLDVDGLVKKSLEKLNAESTLSIAAI
jgi:hypothetical protein